MARGVAHRYGMVNRAPLTIYIPLGHIFTANAGYRRNEAMACSVPPSTLHHPHRRLTAPALAPVEQE